MAIFKLDKATDNEIMLHAVKSIRAASKQDKSLQGACTMLVAHDATGEIEAMIKIFADELETQLAKIKTHNKGLSKDDAGRMVADRRDWDKCRKAVQRAYKSVGFEATIATSGEFSVKKITPPAPPEKGDNSGPNEGDNLDELSTYDRIVHDLDMLADADEQQFLTLADYVLNKRNAIEAANKKAA